ncbi:MAG: DUF3472 domain-containing protein [Dysgonamonadaceae bacterium]|jgi:hypothetical protein|nr:DUF3472 domain-containing protein [Dysgonamonadaceae bacterium]
MHKMNNILRDKKLLNPTAFLLVLFVCFSLNFSDVHAQNTISLNRDDSLILNMGGYENGAIQWQRSLNQTSWSNITTGAIGATSPILHYKIPSPYYVRARVTEDGCDPYYTDIVQVNLMQTWSGTANKLNAGRGYVYPYVSENPGLSTSETGSLTNWTDIQRKAVWYIHQQKGTYELSYILSLLSNRVRDFTLTCTRADGDDFEPVSVDFTYRGTSKRDTLPVLTMTAPTTGYYRYELESKSNSGNLTIYELMFKGTSTPGNPISSTSSPHTTNYLGSPSVHLHYAPNSILNTGSVYDWVYQEVLVPDASYSPIATYWESIGFNGGYLGLQNNADTWRRILFSVWDQIDTDVYKKNGWPLPADSLVTLVDKGAGIQANGFGNEGTGGQSYFQHEKTWKEGIPVKFLFNVRKDEADCKTCASGKKPTVILSAFFCAYEPDAPGLENIPDSLKGWRYIASWRRPFVNSLQGGTGSFIENYGWTNGHLPRKGYYYNTYNRNATSKNWVHFNKATGSHTDGGVGQRVDYEHGVSTDAGHQDKFYMLSGGYGPTKATSGTFSVPEKKIENFPYLRNFDLAPLEARIDQAIVAEKAREDFLKTAKDKTDWTIAYYSSQEMSDNGEPRPASTIIDGDATTFWHSKWTGGGSTLPHTLIIDMKQAETITALDFTLNGGSYYWIKDMRISVGDNFSGNVTGTNASATDEANWTTAWEGEAPASDKYTIFLNQKVTGRYLRVKIISAIEYGANIRINEIDVFGDNSD